jgi:hypothetical protein
MVCHKAEKWRSQGLGGVVPFVEHSFERLIANYDVDLYIGIEIRGTVGE